MTSPTRIFRLASQTLVERFPNGLTLDSNDIKQFIGYFGDKLHDDKFMDSLDDAKAERLLRRVGVVLDGKIFAYYPLSSEDIELSNDSIKYLSVAFTRFFPDGLNIESTEGLKKFWRALQALGAQKKQAFENLKGELTQIKRKANLNKNADFIILNRVLSKILLPFKGVIYPVLASTLKLVEELADRIFDSGVGVIYYSVFFERSKDWLVEKKIGSAEFFTFWMTHINSKFSRKALYFQREEKDDSEEEIIREEIERILDNVDDESGEELIQVLVDRSYIPEDKICETIKRCPNLQDRLYGDEEEEDVEEESETEEEIGSSEEEQEEKHDRTFVLDYFVPVEKFRFATPVLCVYRNEKLIRDCNWRELYCALVGRLLRDYPEILTNAVNRPISGRNKVDFADKVLASRYFKKPYGIAENFYVESLPNAWDFLQRIKRALNLCNVHFEEVVIWCRRSNEQTKEDRQRNFWESTTSRNDEASGNPVKSSPSANEPDLCEKDVRTTTDSNISNEEQNRFEYLLEQRFSEGFRLNSVIHWGRFQTNYRETFSGEINFSREQVESILAQIGQVRDNCVYPRFNQEQKELVDTIVEDVVAAFNEGASVVYAQGVFEKYQKEVAEKLQIYTSQVLASMLLEQSHGKFFLNEDERFVVPERASSLRADVLLVAREFNKPEKFDVWKKKLQFVPDEQLRRTIYSRNEIISPAPDVFFYAPNLPIDSEDVEQLALVIRSELETRPFITSKELFQLLEENCPSFYWDSDVFTELAVRESVKYLLQGRFTFKGPVISLPGSDMNLDAVFCEFVRERERFSYQELKALADELLKGVIYWDSVLSEAVRVSKDEFVRKDQVNFDVEEFDSILDKACNGEYMPIGEFDFYGLLPDIGVGQKCNEFILESFLFSFSKKFKLIHASFTSSGVYGAIARKTSNLESYNDLILDALINSDREYKSEADALNYVIEKGYQKKKKFSNFDQIFKNAKLCREQEQRNRD